MLAGGDTVGDVLREYSSLEREDVLACLEYAASIEHSPSSSRMDKCVPVSNGAAVIGEIVARVRAVVDPCRIILFGSRGRGEAGPRSDYDILIIAPSDQPRWRRTVPVYRALAGLNVPKDVVWWTPDEIEEWRNVKSHFITTAVREGKVLYESAA
jgi:uncharacterized protein